MTSRLAECAQQLFHCSPVALSSQQAVNMNFATRQSSELAEHWASIPKVVGSIPTVDRHIFETSREKSDL